MGFSPAFSLLIVLPELPFLFILQMLTTRSSGSTLSDDSTCFWSRTPLAVGVKKTMGCWIHPHAFGAGH